MFHPRKIASALALALGCVGVAHAGSSPFDNVVVFGDSLSDTGQFFSTSLNEYSKFTTNPGAVTVQLVAGHYGFNLQPSRVSGSDFAYGGAGVVTDDDGPDPSIPTITQQVTGYLANGAKADPNSLYMIWGGANDIFYHSTQYGIGTIIPGAGETAAQATANINAAATQELALINQLKQAGANYLVVFNLPNIGDTPSAHQNEAVVPGIEAFLTSVSQSYNQTLNAGLGSHTLAVNTYALFEQVVADPSKYGFTNITTPACTTSSSHDCDGSTLVAPGADQTYLFADGVHPTTAAHAMLSQVVLSELAAPGQVSLLGEAPLASATEQTGVLRDQMLKDSLGATQRAFVNIDYAQQRFDGSLSSPQTNSNNLNLTLGVDLKPSDNLSGGVAFGMARNNANMPGNGGYTLKDYSGLGYLTYHAGGGYVGGYASYGESSFDDIDRSFQIGAARTVETGNTNGSHRGVGLTGGWWFDVGSLKTGPFANLEWQDIDVDSYSENGSDATAMWFGSQHRQALISTLGWRLQGQWQVSNLVMAPYVELAWNHDSKADPREISTGLNTMNGSFALAGFVPDKTWGTASFGLSAQLTPNVSSWIGYSGRFSDNSQKYNSLNMGFKIGF
ncbi:autotransporter outer membrane beta-barrel domain-containing protein [Rhodanobacter sp. B04]|uniref:autotransporter outer membrane beta-barrel domain-containing protein n=1 Tax=Rhodanobacter sp. B04 TaxID=1945860 RepID=UPI000984E36C|nr:autotransporter domain-containing protein [Rhodanobacter sp. B04]OOG62937.1 autotransporter outer membrane beta-barrel domain-containing protein [Rhodanobacter sp. B04]